MKNCFILLALLFIGCQQIIKDQKPDASVALHFINTYAELCNNHKSENEIIDWIQNNPLLTEDFKRGHKKLLEDARKYDPEIGLDFDPIFDAQDYPDGFKIEQIDSSGYITIEGKDWKDFIVIIKLVFEDQKWLVDGAGVINIPEDKQRKY